MNRRRLSALQRTILALANEQTIVDYGDVLVCFYGYRPSRWNNGRRYFQTSLQPDRYIQAARVSICKSFLRLVQRGLLRRVHGAGNVWHSFTLVDSANFLTP